MKKAIKEFIIQEHANACSEWKQKIEERYPELFKPEIEAGKWYKRDNYPQTRLFVTECNGTEFKGYGIDGDGNWKDAYIGQLSLSNLTLLTKEQIETALIAEAKRRGFKEGVKYKSAWNGTMWCEYPEKLFFDIKHNCLATYGRNECIFQNGKWATIIEEEKPEESPWKISNEKNNWTISKKELQGVSFTVENKDEEHQAVTILGGENPLTINVPPNTTITINT